jgi:hypothetical protein
MLPFAPRLIVSENDFQTCFIGMGHGVSPLGFVKSDFLLTFKRDSLTEKGTETLSDHFGDHTTRS